jgi:hypothetical protein
VRRGLAVLLALSLASLQVQALGFHVHAVPDHADDRDHHHGPAIHHHDDDDSAPHVDAEDSSTRGDVITIAVPVAMSSAAIVVVAEFAQALSSSVLQLIGDARAIDVRSHGPPPARNSFLRGPPTSVSP